MPVAVSVAARLLGTIFWMSGVAWAGQDVSAFQKASPQDWSLARAHALFAKYSKGDLPEVQRIGLMRVDGKALKVLAGEIRLPLFENEGILIRLRRINRESRSRQAETEWDGVVVGSHDSKVYMFDFGRGKVHADIKIGKDRYALSPIGNGLIMVSHFDLEKSLPEEAPLRPLDDGDSAEVRKDE